MVNVPNPGYPTAGADCGVRNTILISCSFYWIGVQLDLHDEVGGAVGGQLNVLSRPIFVEIISNKCGLVIAVFGH